MAFRIKLKDTLQVKQVLSNLIYLDCAQYKEDKKTINKISL